MPRIQLHLVALLMFAVGLVTFTVTFAGLSRHYRGIAYERAEKMAEAIVADHKSKMPKALTVEEAIPVKIVDTWSFTSGKNWGPIVESLRTKQRWKLIGDWGKVGDVFALNPGARDRDGQTMSHAPLPKDWEFEQ